MDEVVRRLTSLETKVEVLLGQTSTMNTLIKYVILPLIIILGALVGVKVAFPQGL